ncbi:MAG: family 78 glycoside hydrolase catalytic domain [Blautia sp.]|nr:glycoside hydrolase family 78 protein [Blautia sp.]MDY3998420.1 family 78 glycoside hydrolase catalytic domain [Blautia sp.]
MLKITKILMDYEISQVGITHIPQFGWILESDKRDVMQDSYELEIALDDVFTEKVYVGGKVESDASAQVLPEGLTLRSQTRYFVRVRVTAAGEETEWAETSFVTGIMDNSEWKAEFVSAEEEADKDNSKGTYVRRTFALKGKVKEAYASTTALGLYNFYINGRKVGNDELTPGWTSYRKHLCYQTYDVTEYLNEGENAMGAILGAGWYKGKMGFLEVRNNYGTRTAFLAQMTVRYEDGTEEVFVTDESWTGADAPIVFAEIYDGEIYDASMEIPGWSKAGDVSGTWRPVSSVEFSKDVLAGQGSGKVAEMDEVRAKRIFTTPQGDTVIDFGQNMTGHIHVKAYGKPGDVIELHCFEVLDAAGNVYLDNLRGAKESMKYTFAKEGEVEYTTTFTFMGFQYAKIVSYPGTPEVENFTAYTLHTRMNQTGRLEFSNPDLNQLAHNILWGLKGNFVDVPTDCPQRNERLGWTGDAQIFCRTACFLENTYNFYRKWLVDVEADQTPEGGVAHVVPDLLSGRLEIANDWLLGQGSHSAAAWADVAVINPWTMYLTFGDKEILKQQYQSMKGWIGFMREHAQDYIWNYKLQFGDWVALDAEEGSYFGATPNDLTCTAYFAYSTGLFVKIAEILGNDDDAKEYQELYEKVVEKFQKTFFDENGVMTAQTQTAHIVALYFGLTPEKYKETTVGNLLKLLEKENGHLVTGFVGTPYFCHALSQNGHVKEAYDLLLKDDFPSWLYQVKMGATTVWEHWDGMKPDGTMWSPDMNSFNHYAYGAIGEWMVRVAGGLEVDEAKPGYKHAVIYPRLGGGLSFMKCEYDSVYGTVKSFWEDHGNSAMLHVTVPVNTTATICLDGAKAVTESDGLTFTDDGSCIKAEAGSGEYNICFER